ncbi:hypothetical protein QUF95_19220 [Paenibacillus silvae]|nr:hypothetical protein [Paenibacillus xylanexedens]MDM5279534.1 hypothetical protein [Paenibacillus silvae]
MFVYDGVKHNKDVKRGDQEARLIRIPRRPGGLLRLLIGQVIGSNPIAAVHGGVAQR